MNPRAKKYFAKNKSAKKQLKDNIASDHKKEGKQKASVRKSTATQDDTGGGNDSGKRTDDN
jgi:hypothetical protein